MRTIEHIDAELRALATYRAACAHAGQAVRTTTEVDRLLDERAALTVSEENYSEARRHVFVSRD